MDFKYRDETCIKEFSPKFDRNKMKEIKDMHQEILTQLLEHYIILN